MHDTKVQKILATIDEGLLYGCIHKLGRTTLGEAICVNCGTPWIQIAE